MPIDRNALEDMSRDELVAQARKVGVTRAEVMTRVELTDEILRRSTEDPIRRRQVRGWLGVARDLVASVIEQGLNLPDAAALIRGDVTYKPRRAPPSPVATVTLAEIYAAQGHHDRALQMLDEVIAAEPDHDVARDLRKRLAEQALEIAQRRAMPPGGAEEFGDGEEEWLEDEEESDEEARDEEFEDEDEAAAAGIDEGEEDGSDEALGIVDLDALGLGEPEETRAFDGEHLARDTEPPADATPSESGPRLRHPEEGVVVLSRNPGEVCIYWERAEGRRVDRGRFVVDVIEMQPNPKGARRIDRRLGAPQPTGGVRVSGISDGAVVRAALGYERDGRFHPICVASEVGIEGDAVHVLFTPRRSTLVEDLGRRAATFFDLSAAP